MSGISVLTEKLFTNWNYELWDLKNKIKTVFLNYFKYNIDLDSKEEVIFDITQKKRKNMLMK
jgi:hypothetical protein